MKTSNRIYGLDVYRAVAIILVVHGHGTPFLKGTYFEGFPWVKLVDGVELFFVLSGFLIGSILLKEIEKSNFQLSINQIFTFWKRRWFRTLPNYYLILILNIAFAKMGWNDIDLSFFNYKFLFFLQNFNWPFTGFFWESWSLAIEEWFYIFLPISFFLAFKFSSNRKGILAVIICLILLPLMYRIYLSPEQVYGFTWDIKFRKVVLMRLDTIIYGVLAAYIRYYHHDFWKKSALPTFILGIILLIAVRNMPRESNDFFSKTFYFSVTSIGAMLLLPFAESIKKYKTITGKLITGISKISYSMYLVNLALVFSVMKKHFPPTSPNEGGVKYLLYWLIVVISSVLIYRFFEKPMMNLRDR